MARLRLRTQLLVANLLIICALLGAILLVVRHTVRSEISQGVASGTNASSDFCCARSLACGARSS